MFEGFEHRAVPVGTGSVSLALGGQGPPVLLLHGFPQNHVMWHRVAPRLAERFTVVAADLRGYGDSTKPPGAPDHAMYSKRAMAAEQVEVMAALGFRRFAIAGHDRGARVAYRMALDSPERVERLAVLDIVPTYTMWQGLDRLLALEIYHWLFLAQPDGLPERLIGADPVYYLRETLRRWAAPDTDFDAVFPPQVFAEYARCFSDPAAVHAACEDYRAGATVDFELDGLDYGRHRIECPVLVLWGEVGFGASSTRGEFPLPVWREWAVDVRGQPVACGHFLPEEAPGPTADALLEFFDAAGPS